MDWKIELIPIPVSDVDRANSFSGEQLGFEVDFDHQISENVRIAQITPPGSGCSILIGTGGITTAPGSVQGLQIVVDDIAGARQQIIDRGVDAGPVSYYDSGMVIEGSAGPWNSFVSFTDPDGNGLVLHERPSADHG